MRSQEFTGKTTQEAIDAGLAAFGVTIADVHVDVLQEGAKGLFGLFGSKPARVRLTVMEEDREDDHGLSDLLGSFSLNENQKKPKPASVPKAAPAQKAEAPKAQKAEQAPKAAPAPKTEAPKAAPAPVPKAAPAQKTEQAPKAALAQKAEPAAAAEPADKAAKKPESEAAPKAERKPRPPRQKKPKTEQKAEQPAAEAEEKAYQPMEPARTFTPTEPPVLFDEATPAGRAQRFLLDVTDRMGVKVDVYVDDSVENSLYIHMIGDTLGILIGRRGETLDALQYLTSLQVNKGREGYIRVTLDTENYRAKREDSLRRLAQRMANRAQKTGRRVVLEPMNPYERRVLHTALQNHPAVTTHSEGEEPNRRVVIMLKGQPEKPEKAERGERPEKGERADKPSSSRRGGRRRRGRRGPKPEAQNEAVQAQQSDAQAPAEAQCPAEIPMDVLGGEE
ncbi:MAG: RNA-binding cell elongation regulator Jag/EloR [Candidatus Ventricola sp.]